MQYLKSSTLIASVKRRAAVPDSQNLLQDNDFLAFANEELYMSVVPTVLTEHEEFFVTNYETPVLPSVSVYPIPYRAIGGRLRDIYYKDVQGRIQELTRINPEDQAYFSNTNVGTSYKAFYIQNNDVILVPAVTASPTGSLLMTYYQRPNELVLEERVAFITSISSDATTTTFFLDKLPIGMKTSTELDILQTKSGHKTRAFDLLPTNVNGVGSHSITFSKSSLPSDIVVGDYIAFAGECIIPQIPTDLHPVLAERVAARVLEALGDTAGLQAANAKIAELEEKTKILIENRVDGAPLKVLNRGSLLRQGKRRFRGRF